MGDFLKKPIFFGLFVAAIIIAVIWTYFDNRKAQQAAQEQQAQQTTQQSGSLVNLTNVNAEDFTAATNDMLALANAKAVAANKDFQLAAVEYELPGTLTPNTGNARFIYTADSDKNNNWMITIGLSNQAFVRALIPKEDYLGSLQPINTLVWRVNYVAAIQIAEKNGGLDWREHNTPTSATLSLQHLPPKNWLTWKVVYQNTDTNFTKLVDAYTGQVIDPSTLSSSTTTTTSR